MALYRTDKGIREDNTCEDVVSDTVIKDHLMKAHKIACRATGELAGQLARRRCVPENIVLAIDDLETAKKELQSLIAAVQSKK